VRPNTLNPHPVRLGPSVPEEELRLETGQPVGIAQMTSRWDSSILRLSLAGDIDRSNMASLAEALRRDSSADPRIVVLDLRDVLFMDGGGLGLLYDLLDSRGNGGWVGVVSPRADIRRLLDVSGLSAHGLLRIFSTDNEWEQCLNNAKR
jgi:anti-anti-sigma factor